MASIYVQYPATGGDSTGGIVFTSGIVYDSTNVLIANWTPGDRILYDAGGVQSIDVNERVLYDGNGTTQVLSFESAEAGGPGLYLADSSGAESVDWDARLLLAGNGTTVLSWGTQQTASGVTAGYTAHTSANTVYAESTFTGNTGSTAYTLGDIVAALKTYGLIAS